MEEPRKDQVFEGPEGPMLYVRQEDGKYVFALTRDRIIYTRKFEAVPDSIELVVDQNLAEERQSLAVERSALIAALKAATEKLDSKGSEEVRAIYRDRMEAATNG